MSTFYANGDSALVEATLYDRNGALVNADSITCEVRKAKSDAYRDWNAGTVVQAPAAMTNFATGVYEFNWSTGSQANGTYVAEVAVVRGGVTNRDRILIVLK